MTKVTDQASGVVAGTLDISTQGEQDVAQVTDAGTVLARRKQAGVRAQKAAARAKATRQAAPARIRQKR
ncbi:MAG: hypothetical protein ABW123_08290 [Cystobacter sp.]